MARHTQHSNAAVKGLAFICTAAALFACVGIGWSQWGHRSNRIVSPLKMDTTVTIGLDADGPQNLNIRSAPTTQLDQALLGNVYETLVKRDQNDTIVPALAQKWQVSENGTVYTFTLNPDMRFSNGNELDCEDVYHSLYDLTKREGANALTNVTTVTCATSSRLVIKLSAPNPHLLRTLASHSGIIYNLSSNVDYHTEALGSGPFTVHGFESGKAIVLTRNNMYWGRQAASSQITLRYYNDADALKDALKSNKIQAAVLRPSDSPALFQHQPHFTVSAGTGATKVVLTLNNNAESIFSDQSARRAVRRLVDTKTIVKQSPDAAHALGGPIGPLEPGYEDLTELVPYDRAAGENDINYFSAGYIGTVKFLVPERYADLGRTIAEQFDGTRFTISLQTVDQTTFDERLGAGDYAMALTTTDGDDQAGMYAHDKPGYQSSEAQEHYRQALACVNDTDYQKAMRAYARAVSKDCVDDWLYTAHSTIVTGTRLDFPSANMTDRLLPLSDVSIA